VDATLVPVAAALVVAAASRRSGRLAPTEVIAVVLGFAGLHVWRTGVGHVDGLALLGPCVFGVSLWLGRPRTRAPGPSDTAA
jgi:hypothetical protein